MNKQRRGDYGNAPNTVPTATPVKSIPNTPFNPVGGSSPSLKQFSHPFKTGTGSKNKL